MKNPDHFAEEEEDKHENTKIQSKYRDVFTYIVFIGCILLLCSNDVDLLDAIFIQALIRG